MVKTVISTLIIALIFTGAAIYESNFTTRQFKEFSETLNTLYEKTVEKTASEKDVYAVQENWVAKKRVLHIFIPHNEIKEIDLWLVESVKLVKEEKWEDALSKIEVLRELSEQIPKTFSVSIQNVL